MNESETRAERIDPGLKQSGWGEIEGTKVLREYHITAGKIQTGGMRSKPLIVDYVLVYNNRKLAVIEAKSDELEVGEGVAQAKNYAQKLSLDFAFASNGRELYRINMRTGQERLVASFPTPDELWADTFHEQNQWLDAFNHVPFEDVGGTKSARYYQEIAVNNTMTAIANGKERILLTLATGTGKTFIAFQIVWKLFHTRWNLNRDGKRRPRVLFLADRNILADQAFNAFSPFSEDALIRIRPDEVRENGRVPTNGSIFFTIFQTFMSGKDEDGHPLPYFGGYPKDYFDFIVIDECHRGGANDEGNWRAIMEYFSPAVQLGLTATPKRDHNIDTYKYFGEPVYIYSLKEGINDGFLTPFKVKRINTTIDEYFYTSDDTIVEGEVEEGRIYKETDFNKIIVIKEREKKRVQIFLSDANQQEKSIVFCANQDHALAVRDLINQYKTCTNPQYCVRVTANDGELGEQYLREFRDNEKSIPTVLTTSQKLSTGIDALNIRNIVLMRSVKTMIEFKQIIGRGTRLFDGKEYFTIYDFVGAYQHFFDPEWDGEPVEPEPVLEPVTTGGGEEGPPTPPSEGPDPPRRKLRIKLGDGKERAIQHMVSTFFMGADGVPLSTEEFLKKMFGTLPTLFTTEEELRVMWSNPLTRKALLEKLADAGYGKEVLETLQKLIEAERSDIFDVLNYISFAMKPITREKRVALAEPKIYTGMDAKQKEFLQFVLSKYIESGVEELDQEKLPSLLQIKYHALSDAAEFLGGVGNIVDTFTMFQQHLYARYSTI
jgi:type I restriction enzyme, R subunit